MKPLSLRHAHSELEWRELCSLAKFIFFQAALCVLTFYRIHVSINTALTRRQRAVSLANAETGGATGTSVLPLEIPRMSEQIM